jgi:predicted aspartyl protease
LSVPSPILANGRIDTGASCTCVDSEIIRQLGIQPTGVVEIVTPSTGNLPHQCNQYDLAIGVPLGGNNFHIIESLPVIEASFSHQGHQALIGRDILSQGLLIYNGTENTLTIAF